jgi:hypothetical protein
MKKIIYCLAIIFTLLLNHNINAQSYVAFIPNDPNQFKQFLEKNNNNIIKEQVFLGTQDLCLERGWKVDPHFRGFQFNVIVDSLLLIFDSYSLHIFYPSGRVEYSWIMYINKMGIEFSDVRIELKSNELPKCYNTTVKLSLEYFFSGPSESKDSQYDLQRYGVSRLDNNKKGPAFTEEKLKLSERSDEKLTLSSPYDSYTVLNDKESKEVIELALKCSPEYDPKKTEAANQNNLVIMNNILQNLFTFFKNKTERK